MSVYSNHLSPSKPRAAVAYRLVGILLLSSLLTGCQLWESIDSRLPDWFARPDVPTEQAVERSARIGEILQATGTEHNGIHYCVWIRSRPELQEENTTIGDDTDRTPTALKIIRPYRWDYPALSALLSSEEFGDEEFVPFLDDEDPSVSTGAAVAIVRLCETSSCHVPKSVVTRLCSTIGNINLQTNLRCAAAEALSRIDQSRATSRLREMIDQYGRFDSAGRGHLSYRGEVTAEMLQGLSELVDPGQDHRLVDALSSGDHRIRLVAARAWQRTTDPAGLPDQLARLRFDSAIEVRAAALRALARRGGLETLEYLRHAMTDMNIEARRAAVDGLAELDDIESRELLVDALSRQSETIRVQIIRALARLDARSDILDAAHDRSWRVRREIARVLKHYHDRQSQIVAVEMLADPSVEVQRTILASARHWPIEIGGHLLLTAMECATPTTRAAAAEQLAERFPPAARFSANEPANERGRLLAELRETFIERFGPPLLHVAPTEDRPPEPLLTDEQLDRLVVEIRDRNLAALKYRGDALPRHLEQLTAASHTPLPNFLYESVLPRVSPIFGQIVALGRGSDHSRRIAAGKLEQSARKKPLGRLAVDRIYRVATDTSDPIVWTRLLEAVADDWSEPSMRLTLLAAGHRSLEVRRRACRKLGGSGDRRHVATLTAALADPSRDVAIDAARAIAQLCDPSGIGAGSDDATTDYDRQQAVDALKRLLGHGDVAVRLAAADALNRLGDPDGAAELQRLSYSADAGTRIGVIRSMRSRPRPDFTRTLIRLLDDRATIRRAALEALPRIVAADPTVAALLSESPPGTSTDHSTDREIIEEWKAWYERAAGG